MTKTSDPPPESLCASCGVRTGWRSLTSWSRLLVPITIGIILSLLGLAVQQLTHAATIDASISALEVGRHEDREEVRLRAADLGRLERENSVQHTEILRGITRLETLLKAREDVR